jgi:hypothetical protein
MDFNVKIFGNKSFSDILKNIYDNSKEKEKQIKDLISGLKPLINNTQSALMIVPLIKEYLDVSVKNDDSLIKMASIVQRAIVNSGNGSDDFILSDSEKEQLLKAVQTMEQEIPKPVLTHGDSNNKK